MESWDIKAGLGCRLLKVFYLASPCLNCSAFSFIIFGCLAILGGFITFPFIHKANSPEEATFLTDREKAFVKACLAKDAGYTRTAGETTRLNFKEWKAVFVDWQTYSWTFQYVG